MLLSQTQPRVNTSKRSVQGKAGPELLSGRGELQGDLYEISKMYSRKWENEKDEIWGFLLTLWQIPSLSCFAISLETAVSKRSS